MPPKSAIIAGGMTENQEVTDRVFEYHFALLTSQIPTRTPSPIKIFPNPTKDFFVIEKEGFFEIQIYDTNGQLISVHKKSGFSSIATTSLPSGVYFLKILEEGKLIGESSLSIH